MADADPAAGRGTALRLVLYLVTVAGGLIAATSPVTAVDTVTVLVAIGVAILTGAVVALLEFTDEYEVSWR